MWEITQNEVAKYDEIFIRLNPVNGKLDGEKVKQVMMKSLLSVETLGKIWDLADMNNDGYLDRNEFLLAMHLVYRCAEGDMLPTKIPGHILFGKDQYFAKYPPTFTAGGGSLPIRDTFTDALPTNMALVPITSASSACSPGIDDKTQPLSSTYTVPPGPPPSIYAHTSPPPPPALSPGTGVHQLQQATLLSPTSAAAAASHPAYPPWAISTEELEKASALFASIDMDADGLVSGLETRDVLLSSHLQQHVLAHIWDLVDTQGVGMLNREQFAVVLHLVSEQVHAAPYPHPLPERLPPALVPPSLRPLAPDPAISEESNKLAAQIEAINKACREVEASHVQLEAVARSQAVESSENARIAEAHEKAAHSLIEQNAEAGRRLDEYAAQRDALREQLEELKAKVNAERQHVDEVRSQMDAQQSAARNQEGELTRLRNELNELIREETQLNDRVAGSQRRVEAIEAENREARHRVEQINLQVSSLESTRGQLMEVIEQYQAILNGDTSVVEPSEMRVKLLLGSDAGSNSLTGSFASFDTGLGGGGGAVGVGSWTGPAQQAPLTSLFNSPSASAEWPTSVSRTASGKPVSPGSTTYSGSAVGNPASAFGLLDGESANSLFRFGSTGRSVSNFSDTNANGYKAPASSAFDSDPFGPPSQPFAFDPFKNNDPFASDPFGFPSSVVNSTDVAAFDPFVSSGSRPTPAAGQEPVASATSTLTGHDFDAVFGPPVDLFSSDPFSAVEKCAEEQQTAISSTGDAAAWSSTQPKRYPPPRPKSQPGAGKPASGRKSTGDQPEHYMLGKRQDSASPGPAQTGTSPRSNKKLSSGSTRSFQLLSRGRSKKESGNNNSSSLRSPSAAMPSALAGGSLQNLTEEQQLTLATMESAQLAQAEARARQQEEEDLRLAIQLSRMDATSS